jgi:hypothetical protein
MVALLAGALSIPYTAVAHAHHGWAWTTGKTVEMIGVIKSAELGNPHGVLKVDIKGELWTVEVGQPWRNEKAGLRPGDLASGVTIRVYGEPSAKADEKRLKAVRIYIGAKEHNLYPERK